MSTAWRNDKWFTSFWNFSEGAKEFHNFKDHIEFHDVTLRDGEQQAGVVFSPADKVAIAEKLAQVGIHRIEAGMPVVSKDDENAVREIVNKKFGPKIFTFNRTMVDDIKLSKDLGVDGVCMEIPADKEMLSKLYKFEVSKALNAAITSSNYAHEQGLFVVLFLIGLSRSEVNFAKEFIDTVNKEGHFDSLALVDTTGTMNPLGAYFMTKEYKAMYPNKKIEFHGHNDLMCGAFNTTMALAAGADVAHTSIAGIGDRAGNVSYEEVDAQLLLTCGVDTGIKHELLYPTAQFMLDMLGMPIRPNTGIVGPNIVKKESGLTVGWAETLRKDGEDPLVLDPFKAEIFGHGPTEYLIGKKSGNPTVDYFLKKLGYPETSKDVTSKIREQVKEYACDVKRVLTIDEFKKIADGVLGK